MIKSTFTKGNFDTIKKFWHLLEPENVGSREFIRDLHRGVNSLIVQHSALGANQTILDISSDMGESLRVALSQIGEKSIVIGVNPIQSVLSSIRSQLSSGSKMSYFVTAEIDALPFSSQRFDRIISRLGFNFVSKPKKVMKSIYNMLMPEGIFTLVTFDRFVSGSLVNILLEVLSKKFSSMNLSYVNRLNRFNDYNELRDSLSDAGFVGIRVFPRTITRRVSIESSAWMVEAALFFGHYFVALPVDERREVIQELEDRLEEYRLGENYILEDNLRVVTCMR